MIVGPYTIGTTTVTPVKQTYDNMVNITSLGRYDNISGKTQIDTLTYTYSHYRVTRVDDSSLYTGAFGFQDAVKTANEYAYDGNGNELRDWNKGINSITYNLLNLPQTITKSDGSTITYVYNAAGNKLRKLVTAGGVTTTTEYENGIEYDNSTSTIAFIQTEEGRARKSGSSYAYEYDLKDHLGNTRVTLTPDPTDGTQQTAKVLQENDYYAFGYGIQSMQIVSPFPKNEYLYNHKELQEETGLYDYGARFYDPVIGRWETIDPLAEKFNYSSPYTYTYDDPIKHNDPDGKSGEVTIDNKNKTVTVSARLIFYGGAATSDLSKQTANNIAERWNNSNATLNVNGEEYKVQYKINYMTVSEDNAKEMAESNADIKNNFIRVEDGDKSSRMQVGGNAGWFNTKDDIGKSSTPAHELGHSFGLDHSPDDQRSWSSRPDIMTARGSLVNRAWGIKGGLGINPKVRKVTKINIEDTFR